MEPMIDFVSGWLIRRQLSTDDDITTTTSATDSLKNTVVINVFIFLVLMALFEINRHFKSIYFPRLQAKFKRSKRVPMEPSWYPFAWVVEIYKVSEEELLRMIGLDAYMMIRYLNFCFRASMFLSFFGVVVLVPVYANAGGDAVAWNRYTLANVPDSTHATQLWVPVIFAYIFAAYYCYLLHAEYKNFLGKRLKYLMEGDPNTPQQTYYTVMVEHLPAQLKSVESLRAFFESIFPGQIHSVELSLDLTELDALVSRRKAIRDKLEHAIAAWEAGHRRKRPTVWVQKKYYESISDPLPIHRTNPFASFFGYGTYDAIDHYTKLLGYMNTKVANMQRVYAEQAKKIDERENSIRGRLELETRNIVGFVKGRFADKVNIIRGNTDADTISENRSSADDEVGVVSSDVPDEHKSSKSTDIGTGAHNSAVANESAISRKMKAVVESAAIAAETGVGSLAKEAKIAASSALKGALEATRTIELLTLGAYYKTSTTAFVTFKSRIACCTAYQVLLSHEYFTMKVKPAPNPKDILWDNVSIPYRQVTSRTSIADSVLLFGALFWSIIVGLITAVSNLESISKELTWLQAYQNTEAYKFLNTYLALGLLLILLAILPAIFDLISRSYEGIKLESEIQNSIMTRYFYYQLANVFVSVGLGSIAQSLNEVISQPYSILTILGKSVPSFSIYFTQLVVIKTFTAVPIELLRVWPLILILSVKTCMDKKKCTRRDLRSGVLADPPMWYGWVYPNILMVLMILLTYSTMSPLLSPVAMLFFGFAYIMYKYQLLYVYINVEQSGGFMWYAVFNRSMVALMGGILTLLAYLLIRKTFFSGPVYLLLPLPMLVLYFWYHCEAKFKVPTMGLSLLGAIELDDAAKSKLEAPHSKFSKTLFRQPSLAEGKLKPAPYRKSPTHRKNNAPKRYIAGGEITSDLVTNAIHPAGDVEDGGNMCCTDGKWYDIDKVHKHPSDANRLSSPQERESIYSDDDDDIDEDLFDDYDEDEVREQEVNEILADSADSERTRPRLSFGVPMPSLHISPTSSSNHLELSHQKQQIDETTAIEPGHAHYGSTSATADTIINPVVDRAEHVPSSHAHTYSTGADSVAATHGNAEDATRTSLSSDRSSTYSQVVNDW